MYRHFRMAQFVVVAGAAAGFGTPAAADGSGFLGGLVSIVPTLLQFGSLGFAAICVILAYRLFASGRRTEGYFFLPIVFVAAGVFLYAEYVMRHAEVTVVRYPNDMDSDIPGPVVKHNKKALVFDGGVEHLRCDPPIDLLVDAQPLLKARAAVLAEKDKALAEKRAADERALKATVLATNAVQATAGGIDPNAGGLP
ncbi:hypothetical protein ACFJIW_19265 [Tahibacter sp. UC22_41]|uniref:hypothetical protein n=1 Tax=Tahibacter sp. UC22_41 TaxID=3350178 RepID=UPI0036DE9C71